MAEPPIQPNWLLHRAIPLEPGILSNYTAEILQRNLFIVPMAGNTSENVQ
jgi:hypothetical protein